MSGVRFEGLAIEGWRQFDDIEIVLHPKLTVITGANGSGKSTLLSLFSRHFGWQKNYLSTPVKDKSGNTSYVSGVLNNFWHKLRIMRSHSNTIYIGQISYTNNIASKISFTESQAIQYGVNIENQQHVLGIHIDSYRPAPIYTTVTQIPLQPMTPQQSFNNYNQEIMQRYHGAHTQYSPIFRMKEALVSMAIFGRGNDDIGTNQLLIDTFTGFNNVLKEVLPESLGFDRISVRTPEVVLVTKSGEFMLDAVSGGIMTLIDIAWRIYMFSSIQKSFVVTMDEPENHLHPSMQRSLMRRLLKAFPEVQFIIATHSPFIVSSVKDSNVFVLRYEHKGDLNEVSSYSAVVSTSNSEALTRVKSVQLSNINKAGNANEILREVLGVPATMPEWVEDGLSTVVRKFEGRPITRDLLSELRSELSQYGYSDYYPEALAGLTKQ